MRQRGAGDRDFEEQRGRTGLGHCFTEGAVEKTFHIEDLRGAEFNSARGGEIEGLKLFEGAPGTDRQRGAFENRRKAELMEKFYFKGEEE